MKILVTGGAGFIGSHIVDDLVSKNYEVTILDDLSTGRRENLNPKARFIKGKTQSYEFKEKPHFDAIFHTAALARIQPSLTDPLAYHEANVTGIFKMLLLARETGAKFIYSGSSSIFGVQKKIPFTEDTEKNPGSPYSYQKLIGEIYCEAFHKVYDLNITILRYFNVYGERQIEEGAYSTVIGIFLKQFREGKPFTLVGDGEQRRDFTYIKDVVRANVLCLSLTGLHTLHIGTGRNYSLNDIANLISKDHPRVHLPPRKGDYPLTLTDYSRAKKTLGWEPTVKLEDWIYSVTRQKV